MSVTRLRHRVGAAIVRGGLWQAGDRVAVAVSGGRDSVALLDLLVETERWHGGRLEVATVDHGLRPDSADDARFVEGLAAARGLGCTTTRVSPTGGSEAEARELRYAALSALPVDAVALAHHRDDLAETVLLHLLRGTGTTGLAGMRARRGRFVRPLLGVARDELRAWADQRGLAWREDPTNADPRYLRNRVRREVMPLLEALRPGAARALARSAEVAAVDDAWLEAQVVAGPPWPLAFVAGGPEAIVRRSLVRGVPGLGARAVDAALRVAREGRGRVQVPGGALVAEAGELRLVTRAPST